MGGYGNFDGYCCQLLNELKKDYPKIEIVFVTPYVFENYYKLNNAKNYYDYTLYPPLENVPYKFAILKRNEWIIDNSDWW